MPRLAFSRRANRYGAGNWRRYLRVAQSDLGLFQQGLRIGQLRPRRRHGALGSAGLVRTRNCRIQVRLRRVHLLFPRLQQVRRFPGGQQP